MSNFILPNLMVFGCLKKGIINLLLPKSILGMESKQTSKYHLRIIYNFKFQTFPTLWKISFQKIPLSDFEDE